MSKRHLSKWERIVMATHNRTLHDDKWHCEVCGEAYNQNGQALEKWRDDKKPMLLMVHHIDGNADNNHWTNLLSCCDDCRQKVAKWKPGDNLPEWIKGVPDWIKVRNLPYKARLSTTFVQSSFL